MTQEERREYHRQWRKAHPDYYRRIQRENRNKYLELYKKWRKKNPDYWTIRYKKNRVEYEKYLVRQKLNSAVRNGKVEKYPCKNCGEPKVQAHHSDYLKPLEVIWLCKPHHMELHRKLI